MSDGGRKPKGRFGTGRVGGNRKNFFLPYSKGRVHLLLPLCLFSSLNLLPLVSDDTSGAAQPITASHWLRQAALRTAAAAGLSHTLTRTKRGQTHITDGPIQHLLTVSPEGWPPTSWYISSCCFSFSTSQFLRVSMNPRGRLKSQSLFFCWCCFIFSLCVFTHSHHWLLGNLVPLIFLFSFFYLHYILFCWCVKWVLKRSCLSPSAALSVP